MLLPLQLKTLKSLVYDRADYLHSFWVIRFRFIVVDACEHAVKFLRLILFDPVVGSHNIDDLSRCKRKFDRSVQLLYLFLHLFQLHFMLVHLLFDLLVLCSHFHDGQTFIFIELMVDDVDSCVEVIWSFVLNLTDLVETFLGSSELLVKFVNSIFHSLTLSTGSLSWGIEQSFFFLCLNPCTIVKATLFFTWGVRSF